MIFLSHHLNCKFYSCREAYLVFDQPASKWMRISLLFYQFVFHSPSVTDSLSKLQVLHASLNLEKKKDLLHLHETMILMQDIDELLLKGQGCSLRPKLVKLELV